ncbi:MAG TPA: glycosyltransferase, partial [Candidatus Limiplasma sp.]|nr:glycosyltransferase [Candidatus Limiplasma sp.]
MKRIVLTGGGTAGHVTPNLSLIPRLIAAGYDVHYIGTEQGIERGMIAQVPGVTYHVVKSGKLRRYFSLQNF